MDKDKAQEILESALARWEQADKSDGYSYEENFRKVMAQMNKELFELSAEDGRKDRNSKKK